MPPERTIKNKAFKPPSRTTAGTSVGTGTGTARPGAAKRGAGGVNTAATGNAARQRVNNSRGASSSKDGSRKEDEEDDDDEDDENEDGGEAGTNGGGKDVVMTLSDTDDEPLSPSSSSDGNDNLRRSDDDDDDEEEEEEDQLPRPKQRQDPAGKRGRGRPRKSTDSAVAPDGGTGGGTGGTKASSRAEKGPKQHIPAALLRTLLQRHFSDPEMRVNAEACLLVGKYMETFVREAIARAVFERAEAAREKGNESGGGGGGGGRQKSRAQREEEAGFVQVEDLERLAPQLLLDF